MGSPAYKTTIKSSGTPTAFVGEATTNLTGDDYQVTDSVKQTFDHQATIVAYDDAVPVAINSVDYLFGIVTLAAAPSGTVTIDGTYVPLVAIAGATSYTLDIGGDVLDDTSFDKTNVNGGYRSKMYGLADVGCSIERNDDVTSTFKDLKKSRSKVLIEIKPGNLNDVARGWYVIETANSQGDLGGIEAESIQFNLAADAKTAFSFRTI